MPAALIVFGGALLLGGAVSLRPRSSQSIAPGGQTQVISYQGSAAAGWLEILVGIAAIVLGIVSLVPAVTGVLVFIGFIAVGAAVLMVSATFSGTVMRLFAATG